MTDPRRRTPRTDVVLLGTEVTWLVPVLGLSVVAAVIAYVAGIAGARLLGPKVASFVGLTEVLFAVVFAWLMHHPASLTIVADNAPSSFFVPASPRTGQPCKAHRRLVPRKSGRASVRRGMA